MHKLITTIAIILSLAASFSASAETLQIGLGDQDYPPYQYSLNGAPAGICVDAVKQAAEKLGHEVEFVRYPWARLLSMVGKGRLDAMMPLLRTPEREEIMAFPATALALECNAFFTTTATDLSYDGDLHNLIGVPVGVVLNYSYGKEFDNADYLLLKRTYSDKELVEKVLTGAIPLGVSNVAVIRHYAREIAMGGRLRFLKPIFTEAPLYIAFSRAAGRTELANEFSRTLAIVLDEDHFSRQPYCSLD